MPRSDITLPLVYCLLVCLMLVGCGTKTYEDKTQASLQHFRNETPFKDMLKKPVELANGLLSIRLPKLFGDEENTAALDEKTSDPRHLDTPLDANRIQPDFLALPGHLMTYERYVEIEGSGDPQLRPVYVYLAMIPRGSKTADELKNELRSQLVERFGELPKDDDDKPKTTAGQSGQEVEPVEGAGQWQTHTTPTPDGGTVDWQKILADGEQTVQYYDGQNNVKRKILQGRYILYLRNTDDYHIMVAWRALRKAEEQVQMEALADACVGTVQIGQTDGAATTVRSELKDL